MVKQKKKRKKDRILNSQYHKKQRRIHQLTPPVFSESYREGHESHKDDIERGIK